MNLTEADKAMVLPKKVKALGLYRLVWQPKQPT